MGGGAELRRHSAVAIALLALSAAFAATSGAEAATPLAAELGPQVALTEPSNGYVGRISVAPDHAPIGTPVTVSGQGLPAGQDFEPRLAHRQRQLEGRRRRVSRPRVHPGRLPDRDSEKRRVGPLHDDVHGAGRFRLHARRRAAAGQPACWTQAGFSIDMTMKLQASGSRTGRLADRDRGQGHRLARAAGELDAALRQQIHGVDVGGDDARHRAFQHPGDRPHRTGTFSRC